MIAIPLGYFVSIFLICAGILGGIEALSNRPEYASNAEYLVQASRAAWPLIAGTAILLLIQIAKQIEELRLVANYVPEAEEESKKKKKKVIRKKEPEQEDTNYFGHVTAGVAPVAPEPKPAPVVPTPPPAPAPAAAPAPIPPTSTASGPAIHAPMSPVAIKKTPRTTAPVPATSTHTPLYPNSPIPGGGRVPQAAAPQTAAPDAAETAAAKRAPRKGEETPLSFFKVD